VLEVDPYRVVPGASGYASDLGGSRTTNTQRCDGNAFNEAIHQGSGYEPTAHFILHAVSIGAMPPDFLSDGVALNPPHGRQRPLYSPIRNSDGVRYPIDIIVPTHPILCGAIS
jgi:hypothetical protein